VAHEISILSFGIAVINDDGRRRRNWGLVEYEAFGSNAQRELPKFYRSLLAGSAPIASAFCGWFSPKARVLPIESIATTVWPRLA
jgi:hypothetical protein